MASSGWQNEQFIHTVNNWLTYYANVRIDGIEHGANTLRVYGSIALCCRNGSQGGGGQQTVNNGISADINGSGGKVRASGSSSASTTFRQGTDYYIGFDTTFNNVSASATSYSITAYFKSCYDAACNDSTAYWKAWPQWTIYFNAYGSAPSGGYVNDLSATWNTITGTYGVTSDGGVSLTANEFKVLMAPYNAGVPARQYNASTSYIGPRTVTVTNSSPTANNPTWTIKGCGLYYTGVYAENAVDVYRYQGGTIYTPPAPGQISYVDPGNVGTKNYTVNFTGVAENNVTDYTASELTRTVRYKIDDGQWVYQEESVQAAITDVTTFTVPLPAGSNATVEGWMNYRGNSSESVSVVIANSNSPVNGYCSVNGETTLVDKIYGSVNSVTAKVVKVYASHDGVARKVFEDV